MNGIKLVCFDLDDTLTHENSWEKLNVAFGITPEEDYAMYLQFKNREINYREWTSKLVQLYRERGVATMDRAEETFRLTEIVAGAAELVTDLRAKGYELAVLSGSFHRLAHEVARQLGISRAYGCAQLQFDEAVGGVIDLITHDDEEETKLAKLREWCNELGIDLTQAVCIADGANDLAMFRATGHGITFPDSPIADEAWQIVANLQEVSSIL